MRPPSPSVHTPPNLPHRSTALPSSIKTEEETGEPQPKLLDLLSHNEDDEHEHDELGSFDLNETRLILLGEEIVQVSLDLDATHEQDVKPLLKLHEQRRSQITDIIASILHLQLRDQHLPDHFILSDPAFDLNYQQSWAAMRSRWTCSLQGRPIEGREKKWRFVFGAPFKTKSRLIRF
ncbi:BQ2448_2777 [Microbotryum intermedium]|uniref:BQ2448_2777 protein n=1 Tax=Microbotryum intermedium TaxID=269621 RepID=A0A238FEG2_9BASI|nr:BQ2448_2777 [Microbotryum intermedium]